MPRQKDPLWEYVTVVSSSKLRCNFCQEVFTGTITRLKYHLSKMSNRDVKPCPSVPDHVWEMAEKTMVEFEHSKKQKVFAGRSSQGSVSSTVSGAIGGEGALTDVHFQTNCRLAVVFLAFDVFFAIFCITLACIIGFALCCCMPFFVAILYAMAVREGASEDDIRILPKYRFRQCDPLKTFDEDTKQEVAEAIAELGSGDSISELALPPEDSECCICLSQYVDGVELHTLPCNHHFHCRCIVKWLRINATCPLCKYNILKGDGIKGDELV
ncbi:hypothetical protein HHK36_017094 [Tetracentron sinense]|uniref:RING-type E3 ubiquitin transferase n=1 Tax=Tetracentron sinense TaxID=13715 RepID=A0A834Z4K4_TETSI|nr:hypothetical protein HHK36_017094 [Tetracentron sinense]